MGLERTGITISLYHSQILAQQLKYFFVLDYMVGNIAFQLFILFWNTIRWSKFKTFRKVKTIPTFKSPFLPLA
jgi:hypothetical protein